MSYCPVRTVSCLGPSRPSADDDSDPACLATSNVDGQEEEDVNMVMANIAGHQNTTEGTNDLSTLETDKVPGYRIVEQWLDTVKGDQHEYVIGTFRLPVKTVDIYVYHYRLYIN